jgi:methionyl aminopeptidase
VLERRGAQSNFLGYRGYPAVICTSPNATVVHGIPGPYRLADGDIVSIDCGAIVDGWNGDAAFTVGVGAISAEAKRLIEVTDASLAAGIAAAAPGGHLSDIGHAVQVVAEKAGFSVVRDYTGHGIGRAMHEPPDVPNYGRPGRGPRLVPGVTLAIEPMVCAGAHRTIELDDGWSVVTADGSLAAHAEHTIVVTAGGATVLTQP